MFKIHFGQVLLKSCIRIIWAKAE